MTALFALIAGCTGWGPGCGPAPDGLDRETVENAVFASDTTVTYRDGITPIGVFFDEKHRQAVSWDQLPPAWVVAIVAAEDGRFWTHQGVDATSVARAARQNVSAGGVVAGGSTLTQQTAKNLFERRDRSLDSKLEELDYALHLEKVYSKREILTFYANLFHVTGNASGLGVAAKYFFDKEPDQLSVLESAFIAGLVKGPANYDPFPGDEAHQAQAVARAVERTKYVLGRIVDEPLDHLVPKEGEGKALTKADVEAVRAEAKKLVDGGFELPFRKGSFRFDTSAVLDEVNRRLTSPEIQRVLAASGIEDPSRAGLTVVTTLDPIAQHEATYGLWHQLTELGVMLETSGTLTAPGAKPAPPPATAPNPAAVFVQADADPPKNDPTRPPTRHEFRVAAVKAHNGDHLDADLGGFPCTLDREAMVRAASAVYRGKKTDRYAKTPTAEVDGFVKGVADGSVVFVSVREVPEKGAALCDLETRPVVQGATVVVQDGELRAMVGGSTNKDFNRATAPRQMGSTFKTLVYHSALTLGWQPDDVIDNRRNIFPFSGTFYAPSPDHEPHDWVSMAWAGVNSENLASIWMLYHLTDRLSPTEVAELAKTVGLAQGAGESADAYHARIQKAGILPTKGRIGESAFTLAKAEIVAQLEGEGKDAEARELRSLGYGWGWADQRAKTKDTSDRAALDYNYLRYAGMLTQCRSSYANLDRALDRHLPPVAVSDLSVRAGTDGVEVACGARPEGWGPPSDATKAALRSGAAPDPAPAAAEPDSPADPQPAFEVGKRGKGKGKNKANRPESPDPSPSPAPAPSGPRTSRYLVDEDEMLIDGRVSAGTLSAIASAIERQKLVLETGTVDLYAPDVLYGFSDFRTLLSIRYVTHLAQRFGVRTELAPVLSLPLGASEITIEEAATMYEGLTSGVSYAFTGPDGGAVHTPTLLISEIKDRAGNVLYKAQATKSTVTSPVVGQMTADILRNVVLYGTGKSAKEVVKSGGGTVPLGGKTGTTNDFKNAAFLGYLPGPAAGGYAADAGWTVGVYVGYDDNRPMRVGKISVAGAVGALPAWISAVTGIHRVDPGSGIAGMEPTGGFWPVAHDSTLVYHAVRTDDGLPADGAEGGMVLVRTQRVAPQQPGVVATPAPAEPRDRATRGRRKSWWQLW